MIELIWGDCLEVLPTFEANSVDSIITDPPYGLSFMGKDWDHGVPGVKFWQEALRVAKPGAMLLAFGGTRTHHRLMCAIEDAEWEIRDCLMWLYGSGFPKSYSISKGIDKAAGQYVPGDTLPSSRNTGPTQTSMVTFKEKTATNPQTDAAKLWDGWGTALKPAWEPIILAMKPRDGTFSNNALQYGVAGLNIDGCRVATNGETWHREPGRIQPSDSIGTFKTGIRSMIQNPQGRWPANLVLSHVPDSPCFCGGAWAECPYCGGSGIVPGCRRVGETKVKSPKAGEPFTATNQVYGKWGQFNNTARYADPDGYESVDAYECHLECAVRMLDEDSGETSRGHFPNGGKRTGKKTTMVYGVFNGTESPERYMNDTGGASRFFTRFKYQSKASRRERNYGLDSTRTVKYNRPKDIGGLLWKDVSTELVELLERATSESTSKWLIGECGESIMGLCPVDSLSTTLMEISKITESRILPSLMQRLTSEFTAAASCEMACGGNPVTSAASSSPSTKNTGTSPKKDGLNTDVVSRVTSELLSKIKDADEWSVLTNRHSTVKPLELMRWLCRLTKTPTGGVVLDPFMGSGSTGVAAVLEGRGFVGIELEKESFDVAQARIERAQSEMIQGKLEL